jgi:hypothetical protein
MRCSSVPSSVAVMGVGVSLLGASMRALEGLERVSVCGCVCGCVCAGASCGGGVGSCIGTSIADSTLLAALNAGDWGNSCATVFRDSSGGHVARPAMLSCSTGETITSSGVGMVRW